MGWDAGLEAEVHADLAGLPYTTRKMFGGLCFLGEGHIICALTGDGGMFLRGRAEAPGVEPMRMGGRTMSGFVRLTEEALADDGLRRRLLEAAAIQALALPPKPAGEGKPRRGQAAKTPL